MEEEKYCLFHTTLLLCFGIKVEFKEFHSEVISLYTQLIVFVYILQSWGSLSTFPTDVNICPAFLPCTPPPPPHTHTHKIADGVWCI